MLGQPSGEAKVLEGVDEEGPSDWETEIGETREDSAVDDITEEGGRVVEDVMVGDAAPEEIAMEEKIEDETIADEEDGIVVEDGVNEEYATLDEDEYAARAAATSVSLR